ncbi:superfamily I DNA/RNA helicase [Microbacterium resistens]|uniref:DNA 3'-5' helicase n=1 Tax=Microbacterium resistens TaxID=156977 RepID=A0ABU1S7E3_9MICO|nr:ATP-dependent DNA helicase [Microbacterium resistens]MDR6865524.1 superfamily I DNA/RNA helicase [Microbacterium resistens]
MPADSRQRDVITAAVDASGTVIGAPGTGKTHALVERVARLLGEDVALGVDEVLVLTPSRQAATALRDRLGVRIAVATPGPLARSLGSFAFQLVRGAMVGAGHEPPALLTGADQDRIIADLLVEDVAEEGDAAEEGHVRWPEEIGPAARSSRSFRSELRAFLAECAELGVSPAELKGTTRPAWQAAGAFIEEYRRILDRLRSAHRDAADLLSEAATILRTAEPGALGPLGRLRAVLIDDAQELTIGGVSIVAALRARGVAVMAFGDPDISSGAFRGAGPELFADIAGLLGDLYVLDHPHRQDEALTALTRGVTQAIGVAGRVEHRRAPSPVPESEDPAVTVVVAASPHEEIDRIAATLREWHLMDEVPWERMAVLAHDTRQVTALETELAAREVPTRAAGVQRPLGSEGVVRDIVGIVRLAMAPSEERGAEELAEALRTPFGGLDGVGLRRLRARLRHRELESGGSTPARELLRSALSEPAQLTLIDTPEARVADRFGSLLRDVHEASERGETIHELLWRVWDGSRGPDGRRLATTWQETATMQGGAETTRALDALVALFAAAKRSVERGGENRPKAFIDEILGSEVPEDSLSSPERPGVVTLLTPATALGTEFDAVVVAGVQDGVWPNVRLRGGLLGTWRLAEAITAARRGEPEHEHSVLDRRRAALHDELRLFVRAVSRARHRLLVTAVDDDDHTPSPFFAFLPPPLPPDEERAAHPLTLRGLVARHRRTLTSSRDRGARAEAAGQLRLLAEAGVPGAAPTDWYGVLPPSSAAPLRDLGTAGVRVSPSRLEAFEECGLNWAVVALGGDTVVPPSAGIGTIVHEAMERVPDGDIEAMRAVVAEHWPELDFETAWIARKERRRADLYIDRLHAYLETVAREGGDVIAAETAFRFAVDLGLPTGDGKDAGEGEDAGDSHPAVHPVDEDDTAHQALVSGVIDRVESYPPGAGEHGPARGMTWSPMTEGTGEGRVVVVDLKTGKYEPDTEAAVLDHAQLAAYQIAVQQGLIDGADPAALAGARLVIVSKTVGRSDYRVAHQHVLAAEERDAFLRRVADAGRGMAASSFTAQVETHCADTQVRIRPCRIHTIGAVSS